MGGRERRGPVREGRIKGKVQEEGEVYCGGGVGDSMT